MHEEEVYKLKKRMKELESRIFELEKENKFQRYTIEFLAGFCRSVAHKDGKAVKKHKKKKAASGGKQLLKKKDISDKEKFEELIQKYLNTPSQLKF